VSFDIGEHSTLTFDSEFYHQRGRNYRRTAPVTPDTQRGDFSQLPWELSVAAPDEGWSGWNVSPGARLDWQATSSTSVHAALRYTRIGGDLNLEAPLNLDADGRTLNRFNYVEHSTWQEWQSDTFVASNAKTGSVEHKFVAGIEAGLSTAVSQIGVGAASPIDIYAPIYPTQPPPPSLVPTDYDVLRLGVYVQDQIRLLPSLVIVPGLRLSRVDIDDAVARSSLPSAEQASSDAKFSPSLGVVVQPRPWFSLYASATRGFEPPGPGQYFENGNALALADITSYEGGVKWTPASGRVTATSAYYGIRRTNIPEADARGFYRQIGEGESRGIELEFAGRVANGLYAQAAYAWTDTEITESLTGGVGNDLPNAPRHNVSVWGRYRFTSGTMAGAMIGAGVVHVSDRFLAANNIAIAPSYTRLDLSASYDLQKQRVRISVAVPNATNIRYATSGAGQVLWIGQPRRLVAQLSTWF
jgi:iron complex outermembrane receptor protein